MDCFSFYSMFFYYLESHTLRLKTRFQDSIHAVIAVISQSHPQGNDEGRLPRWTRPEVKMLINLSRWHMMPTSELSVSEWAWKIRHNSLFTMFWRSVCSSFLCFSFCFNRQACNRAAVVVKFISCDDDDDYDMAAAGFDDDGNDDDDNAEKSIHNGCDHILTFPAVFPRSVSVKKVWKIPTLCLNPRNLSLRVIAEKRY